MTDSVGPLASVDATDCLSGASGQCWCQWLPQWGLWCTSLWLDLNGWLTCPHKCTPLLQSLMPFPSFSLLSGELSNSPQSRLSSSLSGKMSNGFSRRWEKILGRELSSSLIERLSDKMSEWLSNMVNERMGKTLSGRLSNRLRGEIRNSLNARLSIRPSEVRDE